MRSLHGIVIFIGLFLVVIIATAPAREISDPYEILSRHFQAIGGLDRLQAEKTFYYEGNLSLGGMEGTLKMWTQKPGQNRVEVTIGPLNIIQGDNGENSWVLDQNGKLQVVTNPDEATVKRRRVTRLIEEYTYAEKKSDIFSVNLDGLEPVDGKDCYVIKITNNINIDSRTIYINTQTFLVEKEVYIEDVQSRDVYYADYREIENLLVPFWVKEIPHRSGQAQELRLIQYQSNPEIDPARFEPPGEGAKDFHFVNGNSAENIPFEFVGNHLYIPVTVNGTKRLWILDTGAGITVLNKAFAEELGLEMEGGLKADATVEASFATMPPYRIEGIQFEEQIVAVIDMSSLFRRLGLDVAGVLGFDFLSRFVTRIDYANETVSFYDPDQFQYTGDGHILDIHIENSLFGVQATLDGVHDGSWLFDIGAGTTHLDGCYAVREGYADRDGVVGMGHGAGSEYRLKQVRCDSMQFAGYTIHDPVVSFSYGGIDTNFTADWIGILGNSLFRNFVLYCDYAGERIIVEKGDMFNQPWPEDNSGLQIAWSLNREIEVVYVCPDTPAEKAGFIKGDLLRSVNGIDVDLFDSIIAIRKLLKADPGTSYDFVVDRMGEGKKLKLELAELL